MSLGIRALRWLGRGVYPAFLPTEGGIPAGAERYLEDLWRQAPRFVALGHTALALAICCLPPFLLGRLRAFPALPQEDRERMLRGMMGSRWYLLRVAASAAKGAALIAILRDPEARAALLTPPGAPGG